MGGFRRAMPFTFVTFMIGALALPASRSRPASSRRTRSSPSRSTAAAATWCSAIAGYVAPLLTAFYAFRMVFRVFFGDPVPEARELEQGGSPTTPSRPTRRPARPRTPTSASPARAPHRRARVADEGRRWGRWRCSRVVAGVLAIPGVTDTIEHFLEPTFEDSRFDETAPSDGAEWIGLGRRRRDLDRRHRRGLRRSTCAGAAHARAARPLPRVHAFLVHKWYFDELYDAVFVRPVAPPARSAARDRDRFVQGFDRRRRDRHRARRAPRRARDPDRLPARLRAAAAARRGPARPLLPARRARDDPPVDRPVPAARRRARRACLPRGWRAGRCWPGSVAVLAYAIAMLADFDAGGGLQYVTDDEWIPSSASATSSASTGSTCSWSR